MSANPASSPASSPAEVSSLAAASTAAAISSLSPPVAAPARPLVQAPATLPPPDPAGTDLTTLLWSRSLPRQHGFERLEVEGRIPDELRGTLFRNGPGQFEHFGEPYGHPFEADGAITAIRIDERGAWAATRVTESRGLLEERAAGRRLYGDGLPWWRRLSNALRGKDKNTANTNVLWWQGRLFALMEAGAPTEIDPVDLRTLGESDLDGTVVSWFSAHPHRVASRRTTYNFGCEVGRQCKVHMYALPDDGPARRLGAFDVDGAMMLHDFIATDDHLIFFLAPLRIAVLRAMLGIGDFSTLLRWRPEIGTEVVVVPIDRPEAALRFRTEAFFQWHFANAFRRGRELVVDYVRYPDARSFWDLARPAPDGGVHASLDAGRYHRAVIDLDRQQLRSDVVFDGVCEFPRVHPRVEGSAHRDVWFALGDSEGIGRVDARTGRLVEHRVPRHQRTSEPVFVPRPGGGDEADGHVLALCYDGARDASFLAIYDGLRLADGPVARLWLDHRIPVTFHGTWAPAIR
jgi:all-trans-8'-apo-beta-carotenal 15,15'-oxygenase